MCHYGGPFLQFWVGLSLATLQPNGFRVGKSGPAWLQHTPSWLVHKLEPLYWDLGHVPTVEDAVTKKLWQTGVIWQK